MPDLSCLTSTNGVLRTTSREVTIQASLLLGLGEQRERGAYLGYPSERKGREVGRI